MVVAQCVLLNEWIRLSSELGVDAETKGLCHPGLPDALSLTQAWSLSNVQCLQYYNSLTARCCLGPVSELALSMNFPWGNNPRPPPPRPAPQWNNHTLGSERKNFSGSFVLMLNWRKSIDCWKFDLAGTTQLYTHMHIMKGSDKVPWFQEEIPLEVTTVRELDRPISWHLCS